MNVDVNPFYTRAADNFDSVEKFIRLFSAEALSVFRDKPIWNAVNILRSSPGGGKTTLLKIFTPNVLTAIKNSKDHDDHARDLFRHLTELGAFDSQGNIIIAGTLLPLSEQYVTLEYIELQEKHRSYLFCASINIRIILATLNTICQAKGLKDFPTDLKQISFTNLHSLSIPSHIRSINNAFELYNWAISEEENIDEQINSIYPINLSSIKGGESFYSLDLMAPENMLINNFPIGLKVVVMLDDIQNLSNDQRSYLLTSIINKRPHVNTWISERLKSLTMSELFSEGSLPERDFNIFALENFWASKFSQFEKFAKSVANRRVEMAFESQMDFASFLATKMSPKYLSTIRDALLAVKSRLTIKYGNQKKYLSWINAIDTNGVEEYDNLVEWRALEILISRDINKKQQVLDFDVAEYDELESQNQNDVKIAAQLFLHEEFNIPFYYSMSTICRLASSNIEQFLNIAGKLFEIVQTYEVKRIINATQPLSVMPETQEEVIKKIVNIRWNNLATSVPFFDDVRKIMDSIGEYCQQETYVPNAWNSPGINGIAITMTESVEIRDKILKDRNHPYYNLARCLSVCIAYNLIDYKLNYKCKGKQWMILYLNRIYCAKYGLPLLNGKFKEKKLKDLQGWLKNGVNSKPKFKM